jgi:hypothetical protein
MLITDIPNIMRKNGRLSGAILMESWFSRPAVAYPSYGPADVTTIRMDWVLSFPRAKEVYDRLLNERIWAVGAGRREMIEMLDRKGLLNAGPAPFGDFPGRSRASTSIT